MALKRLALATLLIGALAVSACSRNTFDNPGSTTAGPGDASDPTSVAYFNETVGDRILFEVDQSTLTAQAEAILTAQATWMNTNTAYAAIIEGHADEQGTREYNVALGARRASAVQNFLIERGVAPGRLKTVSYGKERPLAICSDESCYSQNRRAVTILTSDVGS